MVIGVISDTHGNVDLHEQALDCLSETIGVDRLFYLGDMYKDAEKAIQRGIEVIQVPGLYCPEYKDKNVENKMFETVQGINLVLVNDRNAIEKDDVTINDIFLFARTHKHALIFENGKLFLNPGHVKGLTDKGRPPTFGLLKIDYGEIHAALCDLQGKEFSSITLKKGGVGLHKA